MFTGNINNTSPPISSSNGIDLLPRLWGWQSLLSGLSAVALLLALVTFVDWQSVWEEIVACKKSYVLLGAVCHYLAYPVRGLRWQHCLAHLPCKGSTSKFGQVVFFYNFVDNVVPAKLGDIYGAHLARINLGISRTEAIGSIVFQRTLDAWILLSLALLASWFLLSTQLPNSVLWALIGGGAIALGSTFIMMVFFVLNKSLPTWIPERIRILIRAFHSGMWPRICEVPIIIGLTAIIWTMEAFWIYFLAYGFGMALSPGEVLFLTVVPLLASAFPLTPSGAGVVELTMFSCLRIVGAAAPLAGSITLINRFIDYWLHIGMGILMWIFRRQFGLRTWREAREGKLAGSSMLPIKLSR